MRSCAWSVRSRRAAHRTLLRSASFPASTAARVVPDACALRAQYTDVHGEVCPAGWKPGAKTMKADPTGSMEYFATVA